MQEDVARKIKSLPEVEEVNVVTGGTDIVLRVRTTDVKALNDFIIDKLRMIKGVDKTQTMVILSEY
jgi:DNA-binding Lrp family transcriptional regulator